MLHLKKIDYELVEEPLRVWTSWMKEWSTTYNERARVPVLRDVSDTEREIIFTESNAINLMLDRTYGDITYTPEMGTLSYKEMEDWLTWCDEIFKPQIDLFKYGKNLQFDPLLNKDHTLILQTMVEKLEDALTGKVYLVENRLTIADIAIIPFIRQIMRTRSGEFDFTSFPSVLTWANTLIDTDWFKDVVMKK